MSIIVVCVSKHAEYVNNICQMHCSLSADGHANGGGHPNGAQMGKNTKKVSTKSVEYRGVIIKICIMCS